MSDELHTLCIFCMHCVEVAENLNITRMLNHWYDCLGMPRSSLWQKLTKSSPALSGSGSPSCATSIPNQTKAARTCLACAPSSCSSSRRPYPQRIEQSHLFTFCLVFACQYRILYLEHLLLLCKITERNYSYENLFWMKCLWHYCLHSIQYIILSMNHVNEGSEINDTLYVKFNWTSAF